MLRRSAQFLSRAPGQIYAPGLAIALTVLAFNALGDSLRDALDPVASSRRRVRSGPAATMPGESAEATMASVPMIAGESAREPA